MNTALFVLIIVAGGNSSQSGLTTIQQEFTSFDRCDRARAALVQKLHSHANTPVRVSGCFPK